MKYDLLLNIGDRVISLEHPAYFIADIAANHDGDLQRAKDLIRRAKDAGADAAKFQHFDASKIVSDAGFRSLAGLQTHQSKWSQSVFDTYKKYSLNNEWNQELIETATNVGIDWMTTPYDKEAADRVSPMVPAFKIGSGDITWLDSVKHIASKGKPIFLATGASDIYEVEEAVNVILSINKRLCLMQCNTNYTGSIENLKYVNLRVLETYSKFWPGLPLGLSDHTPGHATALGAIALGARAIEKHFTDDTSRQGPDHAFAMDPKTWRTMVERARELQESLGDGIKRIEDNELQSVVVQRRAIRLNRALPSGTTLLNEHLEFLRPAPDGALAPSRVGDVLGRRLKKDKAEGTALQRDDVEGL